MKNILLFLICLLPATACADAYDEARARLIAAYQAGDYASMVDAANAAVAVRPGHPGARFNLALAQVLAGDAAASLWTLHQLADADVYFDVPAAEEFEPLHDRFTWPDYVFKLERLQRPHGKARKFASFGPVDFVPEGLLARKDGSILLGSIHHGSLLKRTRDGEIVTLSTPATGGHWSVFGMREDAEGKIWFASGALPNLEGLDPEIDGRTGLFRIDPDNGQMLDELLLPDEGRKQLLGDLVIADDGQIFSTDSLGGSVYRYDPELRALQEIIKPGYLKSPQGLVLLADQQHLLVADYPTGLYRVDRDTGDIQPVQVDKGVTTHGIDGLYRDGNDIIAVINGSQPHRVMRFTYDQASNRITSTRVLLANHPAFVEPTLGQVSGDVFYLVANSQWNRFDANGELAGDEELVAPVILELKLK